jgi:hypothetical protein
VSALVATELRRFFSRRLVHGAFAFGIAISVLVLVILTVRSDFRTDTMGRTTQCPAPTAAPGAPATAPATIAPTDPGASCVTSNVSQRRDHRLKIGSNFSGTVQGTGVAMVFVAFVIGASFIGADMAAGSLGNQLVFEPRRTRVVVAKAVAVGIATASLAVVLLLWIGLLQYVGSEMRGVVAGLDGSWFAARAGDIVRVAAAVGLAAATSYAITVVTRRTVAAVAGLLVVGWVSAIIGNLHAWHWVGKFNPATAFVIVAVDPRLAVADRSRTLTTGGAAVSACVWTVGLCVLGIFVFGRREVR